MTRPVSDPIGLEVRWDRLAAATDEAATTMLRTAFSTIIRESNDYTVVLMDRQGRTMAESRAGIPGFAALMSSLTALVLERFPAREWQDGDAVVTNDPWIATGHLPDIAMITPVLHGGRLVAFVGTVAHSPDIGGTPSLSVTELISEGILMPPLRLFRAGRVEQGVKDLLLANVRPADQVWGDLEAQAAAHAVCRRRAREYLADFGEPDFEEFAAQVHAVTDAAMRAAVRELPDGVHRSTLDADGVPGHPTHIRCAVTVRGDEIEIDYTGSSPQVPFPTNSTLNYTRAYSVYPLKILLDPATRTNWGSYRALRVTAPEGTIVNPTFPGRSLGGATEVVHWRLTMLGPDHDLTAGSRDAPRAEASSGVRSVRFPGHGPLRATVWNRYALTPGMEPAGPAIFEERESSCSFGPECRIRVADDLSLVVDVEQ